MGWFARWATLALLCVGFFVLVGSSQAKAAFGVAEFEAGTCETNPPLDPCTYDTPSQFYTQAGGHPPFGIVDFTFNTFDPGIGVELPDGNVLTVRTDLPQGLSVNPEAVPKCTVDELEDPAGVACPAASQVGTNIISGITSIPVIGPITLPVDVFNMEPPQGKPLMAGFRVRVPPVGPALVDETIYLVGDVDWAGDYHQFFEIDHIGNTIPVVGNRLEFDGTAGITDPTDTGFIRLPTVCGVNPTTGLQVTSHQDPDTVLSYTTTTPAAVSDCGDMPFEPKISVNPQSTQTDSPSAVTVRVDVPPPPGEIKPADIRNVTVTLPEGMSVNASAARGLGTCTDAQFGKGTRNAISCPASSKIGTVKIDTPVLPPDTLMGNVYAGVPLSNNPASGEQFRIFVEGSTDRYGVSVRLVGNVSVDPQTGRLTARFRDLPQAPFDRFTVTFDGGPRAILSTPTTCGPHTTTARFEPWSGLAPYQSTSSFTLSQAPGGGPCASSPGARPFAPGFRAGTTDQKAGNFAPLFVRASRSDGQQEFKGAHVNLPPGITASLAGIPYCPESSISAAMAASRDGSTERNAPSCPSTSRIGRVGITAGTGPAPYPVEGTAYLAGPYAGAPMSMVVVTPALAGPYDLGTVVVRVALHIDPVTVQVKAVSDPIPHSQRGVELRIRSINVDVNRPRFSLNPTACWEKFFTGTLFGGGSNPAVPSAWSSSSILTSYTATNCGSLGFAPRIWTRFFGSRKATRKNAHPPFRAVVQPRAGQANIRRAVVRFPKAILLDQGNIRTVCTRAQWASNSCPSRSVYGRAVARSPLLDGPLRGKVYLRSSQTGLPNLVADLRGQIRVELVGEIGSSRGGMQTTFHFVPDVPVEHFALRMQGGKKRGLLVVSRDLCRHRWRVLNNFKGQNGKKKLIRSKLRANCGRGQGKGSSAG